MENLILLAFATIITLFLIPFLSQLLMEGSMMKENYRGELIPLGMGIGIIPVMLFSTLAQVLILRSTHSFTYLFLFALAVTSFIGALDDMLGNRDTLGFKGHVGALFKGKITTGGLKLILGGMTSLLVSLWLSHNILIVLINLLLLGLMTNLLNLLDLRPGRAIKFFILIDIVILFSGIARELMLQLVSLLGFGLGYLPFDLKAKGMLGDVGANPLGMALGIGVVYSFGTGVKLIILFLLFLIHLIAERYSLTELIKKNHVLNFLDELGRDQS